MSAYFYLVFIFIFSLIYAVVKYTPVLSFTPHKELVRKENLKCRFQGQNIIMPCQGTEPATLQLLARRSNQLSYAAAV